MTALPILWTPEAEFTFGRIVDFIAEKWGSVPSEKFINRVVEFLDKLSSQPEMFSKTQLFDTRRAVIGKQVSVFYVVKENAIVLLYFWDNRQDSLAIY